MSALRAATYAVLALFLSSAFSSNVFAIGPDNFLNLAPRSAEASHDVIPDIDYKCPVGDTPAFSNGSGPPRYCERDILLDGSSFTLRFKLAGGIYNATIEPERKMLSINFTNGYLLSGIQLALPRQVIDAKSGDMDSDFTVMLDGQSVDYIEASNSTTRELFIINTQGNHVVQIIGTSVMPEFPSMTALILSSIVILVIFTINRRLGKLNLIRIQ